ncbi:hypothetical protein [Neobacillus sp. SuZ13]|uniref:hypothetical protein n=1 Tax=Neobacillus sp. SuZ13 TaxID=3047875 RepID=UPI0024C01064|nr:hypothetical protein [Neobacillus sp. SuZ13]WHY66763.1 hypothetical protein QNH17_27700 [Neobacillus sp. SuZ13]
MKLKHAKVQNLDLEKSTFNVLLTFADNNQAMLFCREEGENINAYNIGIMKGTCPCCLKPNCPSLFAKRHELLNEAKKLTDFPAEISTARVLINS